MIQPTYNAFEQPKAENRLKGRRQACTTFALISSGAELTSHLLRDFRKFAVDWPERCERITRCKFVRAPYPRVAVDKLPADLQECVLSEPSASLRRAHASHSSIRHSGYQ